MSYVANNCVLVRGPEKWHRVDAAKVAMCNPRHVECILLDAKSDLANLFAELEQYRERFGPLREPQENIIRGVFSKSQ